MRRVAIGSNVQHDYSFLAVIAALCWRERIGYEPSLFLIGEEAFWHTHKYGRVVMGAISEHSLHHVFIPCLEGVEEATMAQCVRQHAAAHPFQEEDLLIPSDADLLPIKKELYWKHDPSKYKGALLYSNAYEPEQYHWAACHMSFQVGTWREIMGLEVGKITEAMARNFLEYGLSEKMEAKKADPKKWEPVWFTDELISSKKIKESKYYPDQILFVRREGHPPKDRLDRAHWPFFVGDNYGDCHSLRPGWSAPNWPRLAPFLKAILPGHAAWLDKYRADFRDAIGVDA